MGGGTVHTWKLALLGKRKMIAKISLYKILHLLRREGYWGGGVQVCQPMNAGTHPHAASELSAFWEVAVPGEWKSLIACVVVRGPQANGALCSLKAEELRGPFCVRFLYCQPLPRRNPCFLIRTLNSPSAPEQFHQKVAVLGQNHTVSSQTQHK